MSRQLNGTACTGSAGQFLLGLDGIAVTASNQLFGDSLQRTPETEDDWVEVLVRQRTQEPPPLRDVPAEIDQIVRRALARAADQSCRRLAARPTQGRG